MFAPKLLSENPYFDNAGPTFIKMAVCIALSLLPALGSNLTADANNNEKVTKEKAALTKKLAAIGLQAKVNIGLSRFPGYFYLTMPSAQAFPTWQKLHARAAETGYYPLIWLDKNRAETEAAHLESLSAPLSLTLKKLGVKPKSSLDIKELNARLDSRPKLPAYPFPKGKITTQGEAIQADILLQLQDLHLNELKRSGSAPGVMPSSMQQITKYGDINRKYLTVMMLVMSKTQKKEKEQHHKVSAAADSVPFAPREQITKICQRGEEKDFAQWLTMTEHSSACYQVETGTSHTLPTPQQESLAAFQYDSLQRKYLPLPSVIILLLPAKASYQAPSYLDFGNVNACPSPAVHVAAAKWWQRKYGAELVSITNDSMEFYVKNPPKTNQDALTLAREQFIYCPDLVKQGAGNLSQLAADIRNARFWTFWWD